MADLQVGDMVLTKGNNGYEPVYAFGRWIPTKPSKILQIHTTTQDTTPTSNSSTVTKEATLETTEEHLIYLQGKPNPIRADSIKVGDYLQGQENGEKAIVAEG